jgi:uncharacterized glyoxalase superfamily protein PhnB
MHPDIFPALRYRDADAALDWLTKAFGFEERSVSRAADGSIAHAELRLGAGMIMLGAAKEDGWLGGGHADPLAATVRLSAINCCRHVPAHGADTWWIVAGCRRGTPEVPLVGAR